MNQYMLSQTDLIYVTRRIPKHIRKIMMETPGLVIGGGFIRELIAGGKVSDLDMFGPSKDILHLVTKLIAEKTGGRVHETDNAFTVLAPPRMPVQMITKWLYDDPMMVLESFDFTVCQAIVWYDQQAQRWMSAVSQLFYQDLAARRLTYTFPNREEAAGGSMMRVRKFLQRGYNIQPASLAGVIARVAGGVRNWEGMDERYRAMMITGLLHEVDPLIVVDGMDFVNEHEEREG